MTRDEILLLLRDTALSYVGACANPKDAPARRRFLDLVAPYGPPAALHFFGLAWVKGNANSSCGVVGVGIARQLLHALDILPPELARPMGLAWWSEFTGLARLHHAYVRADLPGTNALQLGPGCLYHVALGLAQHWRTVIEEIQPPADEHGARLLRMVDGGGQDADGYQCIGAHEVHLTGLHDDTARKPVIEWVDVVTLAAALLAA